QLVAGAPLTPAETQEEISHYLLVIENANLQRITRHLLKKYKKRSYTYPAASSHQQNIESGLSYHVLTILRIAKAICDIYP
ncbi:3'-5' exonuclease, partial [Staphylococcus aureus]